MTQRGATMDDLEFRRRMYADPNSKDPELNQAINSDAKRKEFSDELRAFDDKIASALKVDVPENMANQLILQQSLQAHQVTKRKSRIQLAMAASVAFAVGIAINFVNSSPVYQDISDYSLAHYHHEADHFDKKASATYTLASVNEEMANLQVGFAEKIGELISVDDCYFDGMDSIHLVFEGKYDNVTVFIIPKNEHLKFSESFQDKSVQGVTHQYSNGDVIIMGDKREPLQQWQQKIDHSIVWSI